MNQTLSGYKDKVRGCLVGGAVGDALGYQIEFEIGIKPKQVTRFKNNKGIISDDTQMALFTANALLWRETRLAIRGIALAPPEAICLGYFDWLSTQEKTDKHTPICWIEKIPELNVIREPGRTCLTALEERIKDDNGTLNFSRLINDSKGSGAVMRVAPIGLYIIPKEAGKIAGYSANITHGHPLAILSAFVMAKIIAYIVSENTKIETAVLRSIKDMMDWEPDYYENNRCHKLRWDTEKSELKEILERAIKLAKENIEDTNAISQLGQGWVSEEALAIATYSTIKHQDSFEDAVVSAVNHDGDSDTTGALAGNIIGAKLGYNKITDYYKNNVEIKDVILELADDMANGVPINKNGGVSDATWLSKYWHL